MLLTRLILILTLIVNILLIVVIIKFAPRKRIKYFLLLHVLGVIAWSFFILVNIVMPEYTGVWSYYSGDWGYFFEKMIFLSAAITASASFWFVQAFTGNISKHKVFNSFMLFSQILILALSMIDDLFFVKIEILRSGAAIIDMTNKSIIYSLFTIFHVIASLKILFSAGRESTDFAYRAQLNVLVLIYFIFFVISLTMNWILPVYFGIFNFNAFGPTISLILNAGILYVITRYNFLNIKIIIQRGIIYSFTFSIIASIYLLLVLTTGYLAQKISNFQIVLSGLLTTLIGVYGISPIERYFQKFTDKIFFKDKYDFSTAYNKLSEILNKNIKLKILIGLFLEKSKEILKIERAWMLLLGDDLLFTEKGDKKIGVFGEASHILKKISDIDIGTNIIFREDFQKLLSKKVLIKNDVTKIVSFLTKHKIWMVVKINYDRKTLGFILLGKKRSGDFYSREDLSLFNSLSLQVGVSIEKARLYNKVKDYSLNLEEKVTERTKEIETLQKDQKQVMLEIAHRLQTPLTIVKGNLENLKTNPKKEGSLKNFESSINRLSLFIYDILKFARLENSYESIELKKINLTNIARDLGEQLEVIMREKKIVFEIKIEDNINIIGNEEKIEELLNILLSNSCKYIGNKKVKRISFFLEKKNDKKALITIADNGMGINKDDQKYIFSKFYRSKSDNKINIEGTGLGLPISRKIVDLHKGKINLKSKVNVGTEISIELDSV